MTKFASYKHVPLGFEVVIDNPDLEMGRICNLWWNVQLSDDPDRWDAEIRSLNEAQGQVGELTTEQRLVRAHMAEFCRRHPLFPDSVGLLCREIGTGYLGSRDKLGCEGRGLLDSLGCHDQHSLNAQRSETLSRYARALRVWLGRSGPQDALDYKVSGFVGQATDGTMEFADELLAVLGCAQPTISDLRRLTSSKCGDSHGQAILETQAGPWKCFGCEGASPAAADIASCVCCYGMMIDASLLCAAGADGPEAMLHEYRRFTEEHILAYALAINLWLVGAPPGPVSLLTAPRYVPDERASQIVADVHSSLGERNAVKEWLAACLLKTIKDNQRWHGTSELIDDHPEATSWFEGHGRA